MHDMDHCSCHHASQHAPLILWVHCHCRVAQHGFRTCGSHHNLTIATLQRVRKGRQHAKLHSSKGQGIQQTRLSCMVIVYIPLTMMYAVEWSACLCFWVVHLLFCLTRVRSGAAAAGSQPLCPYHTSNCFFIPITKGVKCKQEVEKSAVVYRLACKQGTSHICTREPARYGSFICILPHKGAFRNSCSWKPAAVPISHI